jgi:tRNA threonylcarbamoyladenosine biosynthesis protein TsaB
MIVLGIDTATSATAVALRLREGTTLQARDDPREGEHPGHATRLLALADDVLTRGGVGWDALERIAVGIGPGRFTGLRVGVATARALAHSLGVELAGVSSLRALAHGAAGEYPGRALLAVIDARRGEAFAAAYAQRASEPLSELDFGAPLRPDDLERAVARARAAVADGATEDCVAIGDGALRYRSELELAGAIVPADGDAIHLIGAGAICELGAGAPATAATPVLPDYRRDADAARATAPARAPAGSASR